MRAAQPDSLPGGAAGASLALHLGAGLWLALGAMPGGPPPRDVARELPVAFAMLAMTAPGDAPGEAQEPRGEPELETPVLAEAAPAPDATPEPASALTEAAPAPPPEPMRAAEAAPEPIPEAEPLAEAAPAPILESPRPAELPPAPPSPARAEAPPARPQPVAPLRSPRPVQAMGRGLPREAAGPAAGAIPVTAAAPNPGPPPLLTQARYRHPPTPAAYPPRAIALRMAGTALIRALIGPDGQTRELHLHRSSGFAELDHAAMAAVRGWAFAAATEGGRPIEAWVEVPVRFRLDD